MLVVKIGGSADIQDGPLLDDVAELYRNGKRCIIVHGGSEETNEISEKLGHPPRFVTSVSGFESRFSDRETMEIFTMVYCGRRNKSIVEGLQKRGVNAVGLSGIDGRIFEGPMKSSIRIIEDGKKKVLRGDHTGKVESVNTALLDTLLDAGYLPVLTPPAIDEKSSNMMNVDGDRAAARLAEAYSAESLVILSTVEGLLKNFESGSPELIEEIDLGGVSDPYEHARGRMKKKIMGAIEAIEGGVSRVILSSANRESPLQAALAGAGTHIFQSGSSAESETARRAAP